VTWTNSDGSVTAMVFARENAGENRWVDFAVLFVVLIIVGRFLWFKKKKRISN
jgi:hypothetical protein